MTDVVVRVENVSKKFCRTLKRSLWYGLRDVGAELSGRAADRDHLRADEFWAVRDVSFHVARGECVGVVGHNGAGKTTLLKLLNGLVRPDAGKVAIRGRVGALIALGAGFNPILTGRENVYVQGALLGLKRREIDARYDRIVEFSGLEEFMDSPVKNYSSGMYARLGFSVAAHVQPDVLLVDEVLAVGDLAFNIRCLNKIAELRRQGAAVIFVSHNESQMRAAATRCVVLSRGQVLYQGDVGEALRLHDSERLQSGPLFHGDSGFVHAGAVRLSRCLIETAADPGVLVSGGSLRLTLHVEANEDIEGAGLEIRFWNSTGQNVSTIESLGQNCRLRLAKGGNEVNVDIAALPLVPGTYRLAGGFRRDGEVLGWVRDLATLEVRSPEFMRASDGFVMTPARFSVSASGDGG